MPHLGLMVQYSGSPPFLHTYIYMYMYIYIYMYMYIYICMCVICNMCMFIDMYIWNLTVSKIGYWYSPYQLVQDFFHQKYHKTIFFGSHGSASIFRARDWTLPPVIFQRCWLKSLHLFIELKYPINGGLSNLPCTGWLIYCLFVFVWMCRAKHICISVCRFFI